LRGSIDSIVVDVSISVFVLVENMWGYGCCFLLFPATCFRERSNSKGRSMPNWFTFWWFHWILSCS